MRGPRVVFENKVGNGVFEVRGQGVSEERHVGNVWGIEGIIVGEMAIYSLSGWDQESMQRD